jgi:hypothetical protein
VEAAPELAKGRPSYSGFSTGACFTSFPSERCYERRLMSALGRKLPVRYERNKKRVALAPPKGVQGAHEDSRRVPG